MSGNHGSMTDAINEQHGSPQDVFAPLVLPCGRTVPNRLVKAAMYEHLADFWGGPPNKMHFGLYTHWAHGGWGMVITGNVQLASDHLTLGRDIVLPRDITSSSACQPFVQLADVIHGGSSTTNTNEQAALAIMQLSHAGRQSTFGVGGRIRAAPMSPSAVPVQLKNAGTRTSCSALLSRALFQTPREMSLSDIDDVVEAFVNGARLASKTGFDGVEVHAAHGYLVAGFISPESNKRTDAYSALTDPLHFLRRIVSEIRAPGVVPDDFVLGIKLNAADYVHGASSADGEDRVLQHVRDIASWNTVDFIEVSGGNYENPDFLSETGTEKGRSSSREALFARFSQRARTTLVSSPAISPRARPLILLTGGLNTPSLMVSALANGHADLLGVGRLSVELPYLPRILKQPPGSIPPPSTQPRGSHFQLVIEDVVKRAWAIIPDTFRPQFPPLIGAGMSMSVYEIGMRKLALLPVGTSSVCERVSTAPELADLVRLWWYVAPGSSGSGRSMNWVAALLIVCVGLAIRLAVA